MHWFGFSVFFGAFFLFMLQPLIARLLTPVFGGSASVWVCCLVFFQIMLVLGYGYSHLLSRRIPRDRQGRVHGALGLAALAFMLFNTVGWGHPFLAGWATQLQWGRPLLPLLLALLGGVGLPFLWLSATSPLVQTWFFRKHPDGEPYRLYALSNAGSLLGLMSFPFVLEPALGATAQGGVFVVGFTLTWVALLWVGGQAGESHKAISRIENLGSEEKVEGRPLNPLAVLALSGLGVFFFMALTVQLTAKLGNTPLLWVLPFALYLVSFILPFGGRAWVRGRSFQMAMALSFITFVLLVPSLAPKFQSIIPLWFQIGVLVFSGCTLVHTYLFSFRPVASGLTLYYLYLAIGGSLGGILAGIIAPLIYVRYIEFPLATLLVSVVLVPSLLASKWGKPLPLIIGGLGVWLSFGLLFQIQTRPGKYFRDFYGTYEVNRIEEKGHSRLVLNNNYTIHGSMDLEDPLRPSAYYGVRSGFGVAMGVARARNPKLNVGLVGLGAGNSVLYGQEGDHLVVYEISPQVLEIAGPHPNSFPFVSSTKAKVEIVEGDARIRMQEELSRGGRAFDILLVDAFTGGNVPWHLLTAEAMQLYQMHLKEDGLLVLHLSNHLPLDRVVAATAQEISMNSIGITFPSRENPGTLGLGDQPSQYVVLCKNLEPLLDGYMMGASSWLATSKPLSEDLYGIPAMALRSDRGKQVVAGMTPWRDTHCSVFPLLFKEPTRRLIEAAPTQKAGAPGDRLEGLLVKR